MAECSRGLGAETGCHGFLLRTSICLLDPYMELLTLKHGSVSLLLIHHLTLQNIQDTACTLIGRKPFCHNALETPKMFRVFISQKKYQTLFSPTFDSSL